MSAVTTGLLDEELEVFVEDDFVEDDFVEVEDCELLDEELEEAEVVSDELDDDEETEGEFDELDELLSTGVLTLDEVLWFPSLMGGLEVF